MTDLKLYGYKQYFDELSNIYLSKKLPNKIISQVVRASENVTL